MKLFIKNMVCQRCIKTVHQILVSSGYQVVNVQLGQAEVKENISATERKTLSSNLVEEGFDLLDDRNSKLVQQIKNLIIGEIHHRKGSKKETMNYSTFLAKETGHDYSHLSKLYSSVEGMTIEKYIIAQKIERVKELLMYGEMTLNEIAWELGYSSSQHLSNQFRQVTGMTPTEFKQSHNPHRHHLDHL